MKTYEDIVGRLGDKASFYLDHVSEKITEILSYPNTYDQSLFGTVIEAWNKGVVAKLWLKVIIALFLGVGLSSLAGLGYYVAVVLIGLLVLVIIGVGRLLGMFRTAVNFTGDLTACMVFNRFYGN